MSSLKLYTYPANFRAFKALIAAEYQGIDVEVPEDFDMETTGKSAEFLAMSPMGKVPVLSTPSGPIFESNAIARYIARLRRDTDLYGRTFYESAVIDSWIDFCGHELELPCTMWVYPIIGYMPFNPTAYAKAKEHVAKALATLDAHLLDKTYVVGESLTLADITIASALVYPAKLAMDPKFRAQFPNVMRWFDLCVHQPQFIAVIGEVALADAELAPADAPKPPAAPPASPGSSKKEKKEKKSKGEEKKKGEDAPKKKAEKPPPEPSDEPPKEKKKDHPLKVLDKNEPSEFIGDVWKKIYSNNPPEVSMKQFWELFDAKGWSLWFCRYKYNHENTKLFMTANLVGGFVQRSGEIRKWAFGTMFVTGSEEFGKEPIEISGLWLFRSQTCQHLIDANDDAQHYHWTKLEPPLDDKMKAFVYEYWSADVDGFLEGKRVTDAKVFK
ncbi:hypothetical protein CTAYLR_005950 [Chrysophaeum taylorii]|uniref:Elongation factor 1-gamma n=1 Tax=Chrysophaeum taylorii TaxID=2483200 RepID=A0AAD7UBM3_9STRA|nr:hypothetical protein CTAYLR_005950 [Chrysophaeum taylorii]